MQRSSLGHAILSIGSGAEQHRLHQDISSEELNDSHLSKSEIPSACGWAAFREGTAHHIVAWSNSFIKVITGAHHWSMGPLKGALWRRPWRMTSCLGCGAVAPFSSAWESAWQRSVRLHTDLSSGELGLWFADAFWDTQSWCKRCSLSSGSTRSVYQAGFFTFAGRNSMTLAGSRWVSDLVLTLGLKLSGM